MKQLAALFLLLLAGFGAPARAQTVSPCDWQASAWNIAEPWEENTRTFSKGLTRLAILDTIEPAAGSFHILVLSPPYGELGERQCRVISWQGGMGFNHATLEGMQAHYDPAVGLTFDIPVDIWLSDMNIVVRGLRVVLNQASGQIDAWIP